MGVLFHGTPIFPHKHFTEIICFFYLLSYFYHIEDYNYTCNDEVLLRDQA